MTAPARPIFKNGQRLTAERLTEALEFLRDSLRRLSLGPLSAGVGSGLELAPGVGAKGDIVISPGVAVDGRGQLLVLELEQRFTRADVEARVGVLVAGDVVRILITLDELSSDPLNPCDTQAPQRVIENVRIVFVRDGFLDNVNDPGTLMQSRGCVRPWENLDTSTAIGCGVTLGHAIIDSSGQLTASRRFRQGVSPRVGVLYDSSGVPGIAVGEMKVDFADNTGPFTTSAVAVTRPAFFTDRVRFVGTTVANASGAQFAQATVLAPFNTPFQTAALWPADQRVLALMAGSGDPAVPVFSAGVGATVCVLDESGGDVTVAGEPLFIADIAQNATPKVGRSGSVDKLIGLSAAPSVLYAVGRVVPVAMAGLLRVVVEHTGGPLAVGTQLTAASTAGHLAPASTAGQLVLARVAQSVASAGSASAVFAWVVHPPYKF